MKVKSEKNILMTTMSTLATINNVNYYFVSETQNSGSLFCDGISAVENGSKYILSQYPIDEILVVGSKETVTTNDALCIENLLEESVWKCVCDEWENDYQHGTGKKDGNELSAFEFYKLRMTEFIHQKNVISAEIVSESVSEESRRERIKQIALDVLREMAEEENTETNTSEEYIVQCMQTPKKSMDLLGKVKKRILDDIEQSFKEEESYLQYIRQKKELFSRRIDAAIKSQEYQKIREDIERDKALTILEKEFLFVSLQRKIDALYYEKEKIHIKKEADELRKENAKLQYQIQNLKNQRAEKELAFAKYALYQSLNDCYIMKPYISMPEKISMQFIPEKKLDKFDNVAEIVNEIYRVGRGIDCINLYVDMQGGSRTSGYVRNAVLSILNNQETSQIQIEKIVATEFNPRESWVSQIVDETDRWNKKEYLKKLSKAFWKSNYNIGNEKNILFYGLTKEIGKLWIRDDGSKYDDIVCERMMSKYNTGEQIADEYCSYMLGAWQLNEDVSALMSSDILNHLESDIKKQPYKTLAALKADTYELKCKDEEMSTIMIDVKIMVSSKRQLLEELLLLHAALKQERNNSNHASELGKRLPLEIVSKAIQEYIEKFRYLRGKR